MKTEQMDYNRHLLQSNIRIERRKPDRGVHRDLEPGWLLPYLLDFDQMIYGRWDYWTEAMGRCSLPDRPIPRIEFEHFANPTVKTMIADSLNTIPAHGEWNSWGEVTYFRYFLDWLLYGFNQTREMPKEPHEGASDRLYQVFQLGAMQLWPYDYFGDMLAECRYGRGQGFYPTPMPLVQMMVSMTMHTTPGDADGEDMRCKTVQDPCVGTGRFPMVASNYSLRLYAMDISSLMCKATLVNGYLYAPWLVRPFPFLDGAIRADLDALSDAIAEQAPPHVQEAHGETEADPEQFRFTPILKRRQRVAAQGELF